MLLGFENVDGRADAKQIDTIDELLVSLSTDSTNSSEAITVKLVKLKPRPNSRQLRVSFGPNVFESALVDRPEASRARRKGTATRWSKKARAREMAQNRTVVFTGLALIEPGEPLYHSMPARFSRAVVWQAGGSQASHSEQEASGWSGREEQPQLYVNFMSENRFERRQLFSGMLDHVHWLPSYRG